MRPSGHSFEIENDIVVVWLRGDICIEDFDMLFKLCLQIRSELGYFLTMIDVTQLGKVPSIVRRRAVEFGRQYPSSGTVFIGGSIVSRSFVMLTIRAISLLQGVNHFSAFVETEAAARQFLEERRRELRNLRSNT